MSHRPVGLSLVACLHLFSAITYFVTIFRTFPGDFDDDGGLRVAMILVSVFFSAAHALVAVGLFKGKRPALFGAVALGSLNTIPGFLLLLVSLPLGFFGDVVGWVAPTVILHGAVLGYLAYSQDVRRYVEG